ncbi:HipA N-terminal domain-containing protein [Pedobacter endophyticus]|uniref:HipA N-terminal domain-containing protein n=1 Tax=Pedobacter endophyticus TaxID=2789740 RepID=A0A7S9L274_9SPHI|nr:HipA N-terminal domain-containing protein [Pedobacter endophyticus]QPH41083.1 HipA N-terminal domain-containing protein [Pedobacter endophyticus]
MRQAEVYYQELLAGILTETDDGEYTFKYETNYVNDYPKMFITFSMPVQAEKFVAKRLFPFFEGLIPEGWLLDIASETLKIRQQDRMGLLLACCQDCIGAVSIRPMVKSDE